MPKSYTVIAATGLALPANMPVHLEGDQLARRSHQVRAHALDGFFVSEDRLTFKAGETVVVEGELPKHLAVLTDQPVPPSAPTPVKVDPGKPARAGRKKD